MAALTKANLKQVQATVDDALDGLLEDLRGAAAANTGLSVAEVVGRVIEARASRRAAEEPADG